MNSHDSHRPPQTPERFDVAEIDKYSSPQSIKIDDVLSAAELKNELYADIDKYNNQYKANVKKYEANAKKIKEKDIAEPAEEQLSNHTYSQTQEQLENHTYFRNLFLMHANKMMENKENRCQIAASAKATNPEEATISLEKLLGKEGAELYQLALEEELNSKAYRDAALAKSTTKHVDYPWLERPIILIGGPSGSGKSKAAEKTLDDAIETIAKENKGYNPTKKTQYVIKCDGGLARETSQMYKAAIRTANSLGYTGISNLHKNSKILGNTKKYLQNVALHKSSPHGIVIPNTFAKHGAEVGPIPVGKVLSNALLKKLRELDKTQCKIFFSLIEGRDPQLFQDVVAYLGSRRAWKTQWPDNEATSTDLNDTSNLSESKNYNGDYFKHGIRGSEYAYEELATLFGDKFVGSIVVNDLIFVKRDDTAPNGWVRVDKYEPGAIAVSENNYNAWMKDNNSSSLETYNRANYNPTVVTSSRFKIFRLAQQLREKLRKNKDKHIPKAIAATQIEIETADALLAAEVLSADELENPKKHVENISRSIPLGRDTTTDSTSGIPASCEIEPLLREVYQAITSTSSPSATQNKISDLSSLREVMRSLELEKHRVLGHHAQFVQVQDYDVLYIDAKNNAEPTKDQLKAMSQIALSLRKMSIVSGVIHMLQESNSYLTDNDETRRKLIEHLITFIDDPSANETQNINDFVSKLRKIIDLALGNKTNEQSKYTLHNIRLAERYFVADYNKQRVIVNDATINSKQYVQVDIPFGNKLTDEQKNEYLLIHDELKKPDWFKQLEPWEQQWLQHIVPRSLTEDWRQFENLFQSSAMMHIPGIKNARTNYLISIDNNNTYRALSTSFKCSTLVPYEMNEKDEKHNTEMNTNQLVSAISKQDASNAQPRIYVNSLLSDVRIIGEDDRRLTRAQTAEIELAKKKSYANLSFGNDAVNILRFVSNDSWEHVDSALQYYKDHQDKLTEPNRELAKQASEQLTALSNTRLNLHNPKNLNAHKTAYLSILVEACGGYVSTNCKSGKDRTGLDELYRAAMLIYFEQHGKLPGYNDDKEDRAKFIAIYSQLFNTYKVQESAAANTPGSFGIKDTAQMLSKDIANTLAKAYQVSNRNAGLNKPKEFISDESNPAKPPVDKIKQGKREAQKKPLSSTSGIIKATSSAIHSPTPNLSQSDPVDTIDPNAANVINAALKTEGPSNPSTQKVPAPAIMQLRDSYGKLYDAVNALRIARIQLETQLDQLQTARAKPVITSRTDLSR